MANKKIVISIVLFLSICLLTSTGFAKGIVKNKNEEIDKLLEEIEGQEKQEKQENSQDVSDITDEDKATEQDIETPEDYEGHRPGEQFTKAPEKQQEKYEKGIRSDYGLKESTHFNKIAESHPDYLEIVNNQMFADYINNLPSQQHKISKRIVESGATEEVIKLLSDYKEQEDYQRAHRQMIKRMVKNYTGPNRKSQSENIIRNWLKEIKVGFEVIDLKISKIDKQTYLVKYTIDVGPYEQTYFYKVNLFTNTVGAVWNEEIFKSPENAAIKMVKDSYVLDNRNKIKTKHLIRNQIDTLRDNFKINGWNAERVNEQTYLVNYTYEKNQKKHGWYFETNLFKHTIQYTGKDQKLIEKEPF